jgi:serine/threonine protein kinase
MAAVLPSIETIFGEALEISTDEERAAFLDRATGGNSELRRQVESLLKAHFRAGRFLESPAAPSTAAVGPTAPGESTGALIGPYKLLERIGEGGMGEVWVAEQREPIQRKVALKIIKAGMDTRSVVARFEAERQALALMDHPNIAKVLDGGTTSGGRPYFVMDLVKGTPINTYCDQHRLTLRERLELFLPICQAIQHAHQKGIIHRDIKPSNVLIAPYDGRPVPKIIDFGVAKAMGQRLTERTLYTGFGSVVGTLQYMSPEQAELNNQDIDTRSDIYTLGVLLYELLTGTTLITHKRLTQAAFTEMLRAIREEEPPRPSTRLSDSQDTLPGIAEQRHTEPARLPKLVHGELDWIVMKCLEKDRNRRYDTANGLAQDVRRYLVDEPVYACPPSARYRLGKFARRNKAVVKMASLAVVALISFGVAGVLAYRNHLAEGRRRADQAAQRQRLLAVQQQNALEKALIAAMSGDFDGAEKAIDEAEVSKASAGQVRMLRGQVAFHRGDMEPAIAHLEQAVKLLPEGEPGAVAARALLWLANSGALHGAKLEAGYRQLESLSPITPEDYLFKGLVEVSFTFSHGTGLQDLDEALRQLPDSSVVRVIRAEARANRAMDSGDLRDAELALEDAQVARAMLPGNPLALARSVYAQIVAAGIYEDLGRTDDRNHMLAGAQRDVKELDQLPVSPLAALACFYYYGSVGDEDAALAMSQRGVEFRRAVMLYRNHEFGKALEAADRNKKLTGQYYFDVERGFILAELPDGPRRAQAAFQEAKAHAYSDWQGAPSMILLLLGREHEAVRASREIQESKPELSAPFRDWHNKYLDYFADLITADTLLQAARLSRMKQCEANFAIALRRLAEGDRAGAKEFFQKCVATRVFIFGDYLWAGAFLKRMTEDPTWPPWIPQKRP